MGKRRSVRGKAHGKGKAKREAKRKNQDNEKRGNSMEIAAYWIAGASVIPFALFGVFYAQHKIPSIVLFGIGVICLTVAACLYWIGAVSPSPAPETDQHGVLVPANDPNPVTNCADIPPNAMRVYFGDSVAWITNARVSPYPILQLGDEVVVSLERTPDGIYLNANIRSEDDRFIAKIDKNEFQRNANNSWYQKRADKSTLEVRDERDRVVLYIRYLNPYAIKILGTFHSGGSYLRIEDDRMTMTRNRVMSANCFGDNGAFGLKVR